MNMFFQVTTDIESAQIRKTHANEENNKEKSFVWIYIIDSYYIAIQCCIYDTGHLGEQIRKTVLLKEQPLCTGSVYCVKTTVFRLSCNSLKVKGWASNVKNNLTRT